MAVPLPTGDRVPGISLVLLATGIYAFYVELRSLRGVRE